MRTKPSSRSELPARKGGCTQLERHVPAYRQYLLDRGNAAGYARSCEAAVMHLSMWMRQGNRRLTDIDEALVVEFLDGHLPQCSCATNARHPASVRAALAHLLVVLRDADAIGPEPQDATPVGEELRCYDQCGRRLEFVFFQPVRTCVFLLIRLLRIIVSDGLLQLRFPSSSDSLPTRVAIAPTATTHS